MADPLTILLSAAAGVLVGAGGMALGRRKASGLTDGLTPVDLPSTSQSGADALILIDVDGMSKMNAAYGPDAGDRILERVSDVIRRSLPSGAALERMDGGRFALWLAGASVSTATELAERLRPLIMRGSVEVDGVRVSRTISAAVVELTGSEGRARALMAADGALGRAKQLGGNRVTIATGPTEPAGPTAVEVQDAIRAGDLSYHVQPIFNLKSGRAMGVEALLRWTRPDGVIMRPTDFLHRLDHLPPDAAEIFVDLAIAVAEPFVTAAEPLKVSFNITAGALEVDDSLSRDWLRSLLGRLPAEHLILELLESAVITDPQAAQIALDSARAAGATIALDDFGTGLSNMDRVLEIAPDVIKLDRSLIAGLGETGRPEAVIRSLVEIAATLDIRLVVEGLETPADTELVRSLGITYGQGYHLGRPGPVADWAKRLL